VETAGSGSFAEVAAIHLRWGYRRLTVLLKREGWQINVKRIHRLYDEENLKVRSVERKKIARRQRMPQAQTVRPNDCWSADFVGEKLTDGRTIHILTVIDQFTAECVWLEADRSMNGPKVVAELTKAAAERGQHQKQHHTRQWQRIRRPRDGSLSIRAGAIQ
jgi:putative transposase